ncbi:Protein FAR1-related sequence 7 [Vitis vinifera]|uniref:Protein FAR1-related sequence 7 n=1 Tax=Vitis vinifera TaxID=29760 RepID=A0A438BS50_VITVI|nr:Protein FAR1-related sequence 7 [Vitis vinifera]
MCPPPFYKPLPLFSHPPLSSFWTQNLSFPLDSVAAQPLYSSFWNLDLSILLVDEHLSDGEDGEMIESSNGKELVAHEGNSEMEPHVGMEFESEEAAKVFYDTYATHLGFIMRVDAFRRSMRDGKVVWRRLVCNKRVSGS